MILVLMGVSGSGKTTVGKILAEKLGWNFVEADDFHSEANKAKMHAGDPADGRGPRPLAPRPGRSDRPGPRPRREPRPGLLGAQARLSGIPASGDLDIVHYVYLQGTETLIRETALAPNRTLHEPVAPGQPVRDAGTAGACDPRGHRPAAGGIADQIIAKLGLKATH